VGARGERRRVGWEGEGSVGGKDGVRIGEGVWWGGADGINRKEGRQEPKGDETRFSLSTQFGENRKRRRKRINGVGGGKLIVRYKSGSWWGEGEVGLRVRGGWWRVGGTGGR